MINTIVLPNGKRTSVSRYVAAWRTIRTLPADTRLPRFGHFPEPAGDILRSMRDGMHDRINRHDSRHGVGRKWSHDWQREALNVAWRVNTPRLVIDWLPVEFKTRFAHRLRDHD